MIIKSKFSIFNFCTIFLIQITVLASSSSWLNENIIKLLDHPIEIELPKPTSLPVSINFFTADLKFDGQVIKFCEIGNGLYGVPLPSYSIINGTQELLYTPYWDLFWLYLTQFKLPIWYIGTCNTAGLKFLQELGGKVFTSPKEFFKQITRHHHKKNQALTIQDVSEYEGIIVYSGKRKLPFINRLQKKYPHVLWVNNLPVLFERRKDSIHDFFNDSKISSLKPKWHVYQKVYTPQLSQQIIHDIPAPYYVIKPLVGQRAQGIFMIPQEALDATLKNILQNPKNVAHSPEPYFAYWASDKNTQFVVEEYVPSKTIYIDNKPYDPTLRATIFAYCDGKKISVTLVSAFWKIPPYALDDNKGSLTWKHITKSMIGCAKPGYPVTQEDMIIIRQQFTTHLPDIYIKLLEALSRNS